jgi:APA family basic amino acid/polyamine antiporter
MTVPSKVELRRDLGAWAAASIVVGTVIGSGIFLVPKSMIQHVGTVEAVFAVWVVGGLLSLAGALSYGELAAAIPQAGGEYAFLREAYGPLWGFIYAWTQMWVAKSGSIATLATGFFLYLTNFFEPLKDVFFTIPLPIGRHICKGDHDFGCNSGGLAVWPIASPRYRTDCPTYLPGLHCRPGGRPMGL